MTVTAIESVTRHKMRVSLDGEPAFVFTDKEIREWNLEEEIVLDTTGKKNGRGAYLCLSRECLDKAIKNHGLERSLKTAVPDEVYERLKKELENIEK